MLTKPSFYALVMTGVISLLIVFVILTNFSIMMKLGASKKIAVLSLTGLAIGMHGLLHLGMESVYNYNPMERVLSLL